ncbi:S-methyl-5-thioribose kinase [Sporosarcina sp. PTS2304]|uniref:S-methyl-5-thioribose kinase n=1 Tax=Sporosarcina sp. PTS2304 TaxID=2283194 RepID=UPI000E0D5193|nr:S-methyl-5-thioribose kinase [Sporosarcina sp. PTS2304]AXH98252.1 S-methyl-5-thioribose kinase [Sporosarcina sp. PTS2304]
MGVFTNEQIYNSYRFLETEDIIQYVKNLGLFLESEEVDVIEVSDGKINHVYRLRCGEKTVIFKQAVPYARVVGESMPLPLDRVRIEAQVMEHYAKIIPGSVPEVMHLDEVMAVVVMEDMLPLEVGRTALINGSESASFAADIGEMSAKTLFYTSDFYLESTVKKNLQASLANPGMRQLTEQLVFDWPYSFHETNEFEEGMRSDVKFISQDQRLLLEVAQLKHTFMTKSDALIHGDLHSGAIFVGDDRTVIFDTEFALFGPFGFDLGQFIANLLLNGLAFPAYKEKRFEQANEAWYAFAETFANLWHTESKERYTKVDGFHTIIMEELFEDLIGFAGCELVRRAISIAQIPDMNVETDEALRMAARKNVLALGKHLIMERKNIHSLEQLRHWFQATNY